MSLKIAFYQQGVPCHGMTVLTRPLGGTESAMIFMARALVARGHQVSVFNEVDQAGVYEGVRYRSWKEFEGFAEKADLDVFLCIRNLLPLLAGRWAPLQIYFSPDAWDQPFLNRSFILHFRDENQEYEVGLYPLRMAHHYADHIFCVGHWQASTFVERFRIPPKKITVGGNGIYLPDFPLPLPSWEERKPQIVYSSTPFRGLEHLLRFFPKIRARVPEATCAILSGMQLYGMSPQQDQEAFGAIYQQADQPGVTLYGPLAKPDMAKILLESRVLAYPNTFAETFCIAALEAQAAGTPIVTTRLAGLEERVKDGVDGFLIPGFPDQPGYEEAFVEATVSLLTNPKLWSTQSHEARQKSEQYSYDQLAREWEDHFKRLLSEKKDQPVALETLWPVVPKDEELSILVNGYVKKVKLTKSLINRHLVQALKMAGFEKAASKMKIDKSTIY